MAPHELTRNFPPNSRRFGGGGNTGAASVAAAPVPAATPPVTSSSAEVVQSQQDLRRQSLRKRGFTSTILAGDTGGFQSQNSTPSPTNPKGVPPDGARSSSKTLGG